MTRPRAILYVLTLPCGQCIMLFYTNASSVNATRNDRHGLKRWTSADIPSIVTVGGAGGKGRGGGVPIFFRLVGSSFGYSTFAHDDRGSIIIFSGSKKIVMFQRCLIIP